MPGDARPSNQPGCRQSDLHRQAPVRGPMTVKEVAEMATIDAPAATVAVNDLEARACDPRDKPVESAVSWSR